MGWLSPIQQIAQEIVQKSSSTMTQGSATEEECSCFLDSFFARHAHPPLYHMLSKPVTYDLVHAPLDTLNRGRAPGLDGLGRDISPHFHPYFAPRKALFKILSPQIHYLIAGL